VRRRFSWRRAFSAAIFLTYVGALFYVLLGPFGHAERNSLLTGSLAVSIVLGLFLGGVLWE